MAPEFLFDRFPEMETKARGQIVHLLRNMMTSRKTAFAFGVVVIMVLTGCTTPLPNVKDVATDAGQLVPGDLIAIRIQAVPDPPSFEGPIDENGEIQLLYLNKVKAAGYTPSELEERLKYLFIEKGIYSPEVLPRMLITVTVSTRFYYITGEAPRGRFPLVGPLTVCKALLDGGGTGEFANLKKVIVHRGTQKIRVNCLKARTDPRYDIRIAPGDIIEVPQKGLLPFL